MNRRTLDSKFYLAAVTVILLQLLTASAAAEELPNVEETQSIAKEAYIYGFPMVMNYKTMYQYAVDTKSPDYKGPFNRVSCEARVFTPDDQAVVTPNTDAEDAPLDASKHSYTITFPNDALPPVKAFWSLTMYDGKTQLLIENPLDRYLLNSAMMDQFQRGEDGSLTLHISKESPGQDLEPNWLPAPDGPFYLVMRLYGPEKEALEGEWTPPEVKQSNEQRNAEWNRRE